MSNKERNRNAERFSLQESDEDDDFGENMSDEEEDDIDYMSEQLTDSDEDEFEDMGAQTSCQEERASAVRSRGRPAQPDSRLYGENGYAWNLEPPSRTSDSPSKLTNNIPGPKNDGKNCDSIEEFFDVLLTKEIRDLITRYTNIKIQKVLDAVVACGNILQTYHKLTDSLEVDAFIGLVFHMGIWRASRVSVEELWSAQEGYNIYRSTMSCRRFIFLAECLRFDDVSNRTTSRRFSLIEEIWTIFIGNCGKNYNPHELCTVDEQLLGYRGKCSFRVYIKSKPDRYGLKLVTLNDARTFYLINAVPYTGKIQVAKGELIPSHVFQKVTKPIHGTNRSVTCDNWFTSIPLIEKMMEEPFDITITGTIKKNKREIPLEMKIADAEVGSAKYGYHGNITLLSWTPRKNKVVLIASSYGLNSRNGDTGKPLLIEHYNSTKGGTDTFDQLCHRYTVARGTRQWPMRFFFGILDQAVVNSRILHTCAKVNSKKDKEKLSDRQYQKKIAHCLLRPFLERRLQQNPTLRSGIAASIKMILNKEKEPLQNLDERLEFKKRVRCGLCVNKDDHKTRHQCPSCKRAMCNLHRMYLCVDCGKPE